MYVDFIVRINDNENRKIRFQDAIFCALPTGIKIIVEDKQCVQGNAFIDTRVFDSYELTRQIQFRFHLETVLVRFSSCFLLFELNNLLELFEYIRCSTGSCDARTITN
mgnify:FL=1